MGKWLMRLGAMVLAVVVLIVTGCPPKEAEKPSNDVPQIDLMPPVAQGPAEATAPKEPTPIDVPETLKTLQPPPTSLPETKLTETEREKCLVAVGDPLPEGEVTTVDGEKKVVADLLGEKSTVVFFWGAGSSEIAAMTAAQALADLQADAQAAYGDQGLAVIAITPKDASDKVKELLGTIDVGYPVLLDPEGAYFAKVAKQGLPRIYVLDSTGKIAWFDVEFSEVSRQTLKLALKVMLGNPQSAEQ